MNGKKAKLLRADTMGRFSVEMPWESYDKANEKIKIVGGELGADGNPIPTPVDVHTRVLGACVKAMYKEAKKQYKSDKCQLSRSRLKRIYN